MRLGVTPFSSAPFSSVVDDYSELSLFSALIANQDADRAYLLEAWPYDPVTEALVQVNFSLGLKRPLLDGRFYPARLGTIVNTDVQLFSDNIGRGGSFSTGVIKILIGDEDHDDMLDYAWDGRDVRILMGAEGFDYTEFEPVFVGAANDIEFDLNHMSIALRDKTEMLGVDIQTTVYAGTGGLEGGADLKGKPKPISYGAPQNISPVLVDRANLIYQFHDSSAQSVDAVYDGALALTAAGDVADITATSVTSGQYKTQLSGGYIRLGAEPSKTLTADVQGDDTGSYVSTAADIVQRIVEDRTTFTSDDIDLQSVATTNTANSAAVSWYGSQGSVASVISDLLGSIGGAYVFNRAGKLVMSVFQFSSSVGTIYENDIEKLQRVRPPKTTWRRHLGYAKCWTVQGQADVLGAATDSRKDFVSNEFRYSTDEDTAIKTRRAGAEAVELDTLLDSSTDGDSEVTRQQALFGVDRNVYLATVRRQQFKYRAGQTITLSYPRFGFPKDCIILSVSENSDKRETTYRLFA